jgi:diguanylate cyclase (GGDEF)-like protein
MSKSSDPNFVAVTDNMPLGAAAPEALSVAAVPDKSTDAGHAKIHIVHARRQADANQGKRQTARIRRLLLTSVFGLLYLAAIIVFYLQGLVDQFALTVAVVLIGSAIVLFYTCFALGWNQKAKDKSLRIPMTLCSVAIMLLLVYLAPPTRILFTPFLFLMMAFVMHRVSSRTMLLLALATLAGYTLVVALHYYPQGAWRDLGMEWAHLLGLSLTLPGFALLASRMQRLHSALFKATRKIKDIEEDAQRDVLLGCFNRRYIVAALEQQKRMADETGAPLCLAVMDLDHFKRINDEAGHLSGDEVLRTFARIAEGNVRQRDIFGRYGGEEFLLVLPETSLLAALNIAERVREQVEHFAWDGKLRNRVTVSIGLTQYVPGESVLDLFSRTDTAMYMAKQGGRNQVVVEEPTAEDAA